MSALTIHAAPFLPARDRPPGRRRPARHLVIMPAPVPVRSGAVRITRRGRLLLTASMVLVLVLACVVGMRTWLPAPQFSAAPVSAGYVTVIPGDTLWEIAGELAPASDPRDVVASIVDLNDLDSAQVFAGQRLAVPAGG